MTLNAGVAERLSDDMPESRPTAENIIRITETGLVRGKAASGARSGDGGFTETGKLYDRKEWKTHKERVRAGDVLFRPNYNDDPDPAVLETVEKLVDTSKVIELERIDYGKLLSSEGDFARRFLVRMTEDATKGRPSMLLDVKVARPSGFVPVHSPYQSLSSTREVRSSNG